MASPNLLFILIDDLGWRDLSCYGSTFYETPNLDRLAAQGMRFSDAYAACPVCSPTRASLLTGKYPARLGLTDWIDFWGRTHPARGKLVDVPYVDHLPLAETTVATALRDAGYATWHVGKWHLGGEPYWPEQQGFDVNIAGCERGAPKTYFAPWQIPTLSEGEPGDYLTDRLTDEAIALIEQNARDGDQPFFLNLWYYTVHTPIEAKAEKIRKYEQKARDLGLDQLPTFEEGDFFPMQHKRDQRIRRRLVQSDPVYAAMIESLDGNIGRLLSTLEALGIADETAIVFTSDNGGLATAEGSPTTNAPLAEGKGWMYEGGTREPLIVHWPGVTPPGNTCDVPVSSPDFYPTLLAMAGVDGLPNQHVDGTSFADLLRGETSEPTNRPPLFWHYPHYGNQGGTPGSSIRDGDYKLIEFFENGRRELYNLREDIGETRNLVDEEPAVAQRLYEMLTGWREEIEAKIPQPNPEWNVD